jgi:RNA polymerase sigma-32 factor
MTHKTSPLLLAAKATPVLSEERERALFAAYRTKGDQRARNSIAIAHLRLVIGEAGRFARYRIAADELITEGNIAVMQAIESFDTERGVRFCAYARHWVRSSIMAYVIKNRSLVTISGTKANKRLFFQLERTRAALAAAHNGRLPENANALIASALGVTETSVENMSTRLGGDQSVDVAAGPDDETSKIETIPCNDDDPEAALMKQQDLATAVSGLSTLSERERHIILARVYTDAEEIPELSDLAAIFGVTPQRVHQIEKAALRKIREAVLMKTG